MGASTARASLGGCCVSPFLECGLNTANWGDLFTYLCPIFMLPKQKGKPHLICIVMNNHSLIPSVGFEHEKLVAIRRKTCVVRSLVVARRPSLRGGRFVCLPCLLGRLS